MERDLMVQLIGQNHQLLTVCIVLLLLIIGERLIVAAITAPRTIKKLFGSRANGDPNEEASYGQMCKAHDLMREMDDRRAAQTVEALKGDSEKRFNAIDRQLEISRRKDNMMLIILRDLRSFMIYGQKPEKEILEIEEDNA